MATVSPRSSTSTAIALGSVFVAVVAGLVTRVASAAEPVASAAEPVTAAATPPATAGATPVTAPEPVDPRAWETAPATRRSGFAMGVALGFGLSSIAGFPNDVKKIGYAPYYTSTGVRPTPTLAFWLGGALTDWLTFGLGFMGSNVFGTGDDKARSTAGMFHVEIFPLFHVRDSLRDLGLFLDVGTGVTTVTSPKDEKLVDSSAASFIGGGVLWEPVKFWRIRGGPFLMGNYMWSDTVRRPAVFAGWRMSLYSGPAPQPAVPTSPVLPSSP